MSQYVYCIDQHFSITIARKWKDMLQRDIMYVIYIKDIAVHFNSSSSSEVLLFCCSLFCDLMIIHYHVFFCSSLIPIMEWHFYKYLFSFVFLLLKVKNWKNVFLKLVKLHFEQIPFNARLRYSHGDIRIWDLRLFWGRHSKLNFYECWFVYFVSSFILRKIFAKTNTLKKNPLIMNEMGKCSIRC